MMLDLSDEEEGIVLSALNAYWNQMRSALDPECGHNPSRFEAVQRVWDLYQRIGGYQDDAPDTATLHVLPVNDLIEHEDSDDCICGPMSTLIRRGDGSDGWIVTHNSLDGRELNED